MPIAVIAFDFDPLLHLAEGLVVRWQTVALAAVIAAALIAAGWIARRVDLRPDDLLFIAVGIVPGAVIGGRLGYVAAPSRLLRLAPRRDSSTRRSAGSSWAWPSSAAC